MNGWETVWYKIVDDKLLFYGTSHAFVDALSNGATVAPASEPQTVPATEIERLRDIVRELQAFIKAMQMVDDYEEWSPSHRAALKHP
jgi:hypothetical protein